MAGHGPKDQVNLTDLDSRIMPVADGGFEQAYIAQALVAADSLLVVTYAVVQAPNDKRQIEPALEALARIPEALGKPETMLADSGYVQRGQRERLRRGRDRAVERPAGNAIDLSWKDRFARHYNAPGEADTAGSDDTSTGDAQGPADSIRPAQANVQRPVFGIIKSAMGFRQFSLRGLDKVTGEWNLVTLAWNIKRMFTLQYALGRRPDSVLREKE